MKKLINKLNKKLVIFISLIFVVLVCLFLNVINGKAKHLPVIGRINILKKLYPKI